MAWLTCTVVPRVVGSEGSRLGSRRTVTGQLALLVTRPCFYSPCPSANTARMPHVWLARGCPTLPPDARRVGARCVRSAQSVAGVRCCGGSTCVSVCLSQQSCDGDDGQAATLAQARAYCERRGRRLCTRAELGRGFCCKSGCAMDGMLVWTEDACTAAPDNGGLPAAERWPPPRVTGRWLSRAARCLGLSASNLSLHYPADADAHFLEMRRQLRPWTQGALTLTLTLTLTLALTSASAPRPSPAPPRAACAPGQGEGQG